MWKVFIFSQQYKMQRKNKKTVHFGMQNAFSFIFHSIFLLVRTLFNYVYPSLRHLQTRFIVKFFFVLFLFISIFCSSFLLVFSYFYLCFGVYISNDAKCHKRDNIICYRNLCCLRAVSTSRHRRYRRHDHVSSMFCIIRG